MPDPLKPRQAGDLSDEQTIEELCKKVAEKLGMSKSLEIDQDLVTEIKTEASKGTSGWQFVKQALVGEKLGTSPFVFENLLMMEG